MIVFDKVTKYYGAHPAVLDLDFTIEKGECVGFLGLNGAGKTTTLRLLSCLLLPTSGSIKVRGLDAEVDPHEIRKLIGFLPDSPPLYPEMRVHEYLRFAGHLRQMGSGRVKARLPEVLELCGLADVQDELIDQLSHGFKQRVGIAQAIVHEPALLILDEPIQGLDPVQIVEMRNMIRDLRGKHTILLSTHILSEIEQTCDRILMLHRGRITAQGTEEELATQFVDEVVLDVEVRGPLAEVRAVLESVAKVTNVAATTGAASDSAVHVRVRAGEDVREEVARAVVRAELGLLKLERVATGLEDIFVRLSKSDAEASKREKGKAA